jgi:hypothetical protein
MAGDSLLGRWKSMAGARGISTHTTGRESTCAHRAGEGWETCVSSLFVEHWQGVAPARSPPQHDALASERCEQQQAGFWGASLADAQQFPPTRWQRQNRIAPADTAA